MRIYDRKSCNGVRSYSTSYSGMKDVIDYLYNYIDETYREAGEKSRKNYNGLDHFEIHGYNVYGVCAHSIVINPRKSIITVRTQLGRSRSYNRDYSEIIPERTYTIHSYPKKRKARRPSEFVTKIKDSLLIHYWVEPPYMTKRMWIKLGSIHIT